MDIDMIRRHLAMAERHVLEGTQRLRRQRELIEQLRQDSREAKMALKLLSEFEESFALAVEIGIWFARSWNEQKGNRLTVGVPNR